MSIPYNLRIRKVFFDLIRSGEKTVEYRTYKEFYIGLEDGIKSVRFHYQKRPYMIVAVKRIDVIRTPEHLKSLSIPFGPRVYAISLGKILETNT